MTRLHFAVQIALLFLARAAWPSPITECLENNPADSAASIQHFNTTASIAQMNILSARGAVDGLTARQASCPNPSTNSLCPSNFCFIYQQNNDGSAWATCCATGWFLQLNSADWKTQKCVLNGVSEPPVRPVSCGGSINGNPGTTSGWACVYSSQNINGAQRVQQSTWLILALACAWFGIWFF